MATPRIQITPDLLATVLRTAFDGVWIVDGAGHFVEVNAAYCALIGYSRDELLGMSIADVEATESPDEVAAHAQKVRTQGGDRFVTRHRRKDGTILDVEVSAHYLAEGGGLFCVSVRDITERLRRDQALRESQEGLRRDLHHRVAEGALQAATLAAAANAIVITDRSGTIQWVNPAFTTLTGYRSDEAVGQSPRLLKSSQHDTLFYQSLWACITDGRVWTGEVVNRRRDGTLYTESQTITPVRDASGAITHFIAIKQDVSAQKLLEEELRQAQKMEAIGRLAAGVAHDFNNLLTVIQGRSALLQAHLPTDSALRRHIDLVEQASLRAAALTRQLLAFSRKQVVDPKALEIATLVRGFEPILRRLIGEDIALSITSAPPDARARIDPGQLEQVVLNLVVNARDAMPEGGQLLIETRNVEVDAAYAAAHLGAQPGPYILLAVSDTGIGMDAATQARIFEPFFTTKGDQGTGLGLATVYGIVKQAGGTVRVYSEPGVGTTFRIYLPRLTEDLAAVGPEVSEVPPRGTETILLVEDEEALLHLTREVLERLGYAVLDARHGAEALLVAEGHPDRIHLLLTDVIMPNMNGRELARQLSPTRPDLPVLFMSGYTAGVIERHGMLDPTVTFIQKPFTPAQLARKVREVLDAAAANAAT